MEIGLETRIRPPDVQVGTVSTKWRPLTPYGTYRRHDPENRPCPTRGGRPPRPHGRIGHSVSDRDDTSSTGASACRVRRAAGARTLEAAFPPARWVARCRSSPAVARRQQFAVVTPKPPSPNVSGAFPNSLGIRPVGIGPPFACAAGVESVRFAPVIVLST